MAEFQAGFCELKHVRLGAQETSARGWKSRSRLNFFAVRLNCSRAKTADQRPAAGESGCRLKLRAGRLAERQPPTVSRQNYRRSLDSTCWRVRLRRLAQVRRRKDSVWRSQSPLASALAEPRFLAPPTSLPESLATEQPWQARRTIAAHASLAPAALEQALARLANQHARFLRGPSLPVCLSQIPPTPTAG